jgi:hypothetical protein
MSSDPTETIPDPKLTSVEVDAILRQLGEDEHDPECCETCAGAVSATEKLETALSEVPGKDQHRVEIDYDGYDSHVTLIHPESGCPVDENGECYLTDWIEAEGPELLRGKLTVPVRVEEAADRDHPLFHLQEEADCQPKLQSGGEDDDGYIRSGLATEVIDHLKAREKEAAEQLERLTKARKAEGVERSAPATAAQLVAYTEKRIYRDVILTLADTDYERHTLGEPDCSEDQGDGR